MAAYGRDLEAEVPNDVSRSSELPASRCVDPTVEALSRSVPPSAGGVPRLGIVTDERDLRLTRATQRAVPFDEQQAIESARVGDEAAFALLVRRYGQPILSICYASVLNPADAEDLAQEVFFAAWRSLPRFRGDAAFSTWLFTLARNRCVDRARRARVRPQLVAESEHSPAAHHMVDEAPKQLAKAILASAGTLSLPLRQALLLRDVQGLSYEEIAQLQDVPLGTVRSRIAAARAAVVKSALE